MSANDGQVGGDHYRSSYQHWDFQRDMGFDYLQAQVAKYVTRWRAKGGVQDLEKAAHFNYKLIELQSERSAKLGEYSLANNLTQLEQQALVALMDGLYYDAQDILQRIMRGEPDKPATGTPMPVWPAIDQIELTNPISDTDEQGGPTRDYVDQDQRQFKLGSGPENKSYRWTCPICGESKTVPGNYRGQKMLEEFIVDHKACKNFAETQPYGGTDD